MPLVNLQTDLKSLKFGKDKPGGGSSKQPYIQTPIPGNNEELPEKKLNATDFLLRGGVESASDSSTDVIRLTKYFTDFKSASGALFVAKQNSLSSIAVRTQASGNGTGMGLNEGTYTPLSTFAQAGIGFIGGHVDKQGLNLIQGITVYGPISRKGNSVINQVIGAPDGTGNRLVDLTTEHIGKFSGENLFSYFGGPNSALGVTKTNIKFATDNKGAVLKSLSNESFTESYNQNQTGIKGSDTSREGSISQFKSPLGVSSKYVELNGGGKLISDGQIAYDTVDGGILAEVSKENGISWVNVDGTLPSPKLQNPTNLFTYDIGSMVAARYDAKQPDSNFKIHDNITADDGISWRQILTNPYATGTKGTLATKEYISRDNKTSNPTDLFLYDIGSMVAAKYVSNQPGDPFENFDIHDNITADDGISWRQILTNPYATGVKGSLSSKEYVLRNNQIPNPQGLFKYKNTETPLKKFALNNMGYKGLANDNIINGTTNWEVNPFLRMPNATGTKSLSTNQFLHIASRQANHGTSTDNFIKINQITPTSNKWESFSKKKILKSPKTQVNINSFTSSPKSYTFNPDAITSVYEIGTFNPSLKFKNPKDYGFGNQNYKTLSQNQLYSFAKTMKDNPGRVTDFRKTLLKGEKNSTIMSIAPSYGGAIGGATVDNSTGTNLYHYTSPGQPGNILSYTNGKIGLTTDGRGSIVDKINYHPIYRSSKGSKKDNQVGDLVNFRIGAINHKNPNHKDYLHFRAYIDSFEDSYTGNWDSINYMGRGESFYKYKNFERNISLSFTVAAQSRGELERQYQKLNYLVSNLAPSYTEEGYMAGSLVCLTVGNWCYELPGFITAMGLSVPEESPWEIGINDEGERKGKETLAAPEPPIMQLPHIVKVTGFSFTPIHTFRPSKENYTFETTNDDYNEIKNGTDSFEKYIGYRNNPQQQRPTQKPQSGNPPPGKKETITPTDSIEDLLKKINKTAPVYDLKVEEDPFKFQDLQLPDAVRDNTTNVTQGGKEIILPYEFNDQKFKF